MRRDQIPRTASQITSVDTDDGIVLVSAETGKIRVLNPVGSAVWRLIDGRKSLGQIEDFLTEEYHLQREEARHDLYEFIAELEERELVRLEDSFVEGRDER